MLIFRLSKTLFHRYKNTRMLQVYCKNNQSYIKVENGSSLLEIYRDLNLQMPYQVVSAKVNNKTLYQQGR